MDLTQLFDRYQLFARVYPMLLLLLPSVFTVLAFRPELLGSGPVGVLLSIAIFSGMLYLLSSAARSAGKRLEDRLTKTWGGYPTTLMLRHRDSSFHEITKQRYHRYLGTHIPGMARFPSALQEHQDPDGADRIYSSAVLWLKEQRRDEKTYPIIIKELTEYGFRRNLAGLKAVGIILYLVQAVFGIWAIALLHGHLFCRHGFWLGLGQALNAEPLIAGAVFLNLLALTCCLWILSDAWVGEAARTYARALLASCDA